MGIMSCARLFILVLLGLSAGNSSYADDSGCVGWDDRVDILLFDPLKDEIKEAASEFYSLPDFESRLGWGVSLKLEKSTVGDLTSFDLVHLSKVGNASYMCQSGSNITLAMDLRLADLELTVDDFVLTLPVLPNIGDTKTSIKNSGNVISISVSIISDSDSDNCTVALNYIQLRELGVMTVNFEHGVFNSVYQFAFNHLYSLIMKIMNHYGVVDRLNESLLQQATTLIAQQGQKICDLNI